ncbi:hypothetical protein HJC23_013783 [Cyclotella cryptica]|uniref:DNA 3'-5' helicase n=1 Tax=Cyclotella cryptica TaxID=29204 RepID=A0ABD3PG06_9STRA
MARQRKADALLDAKPTSSARKTNESTMKNPYVSRPRMPAPTVPSTKSKEISKTNTSASAPAFQKRNARDKSNIAPSNIPHTTTDKLLLGLLDGKVKHGATRGPTHPKERQTQNHSRGKQEKRPIETGVDVIHKKGNYNSSNARFGERQNKRIKSLDLVLPPPVRCYPRAEKSNQSRVMGNANNKAREISSLRLKGPSRIGPQRYTKTDENVANGCNIEISEDQSKPAVLSSGTPSNKSNLEETGLPGDDFHDRHSNSVMGGARVHASCDITIPIQPKEPMDSTLLEDGLAHTHSVAVKPLSLGIGRRTNRFSGLKPDKTVLTAPRPSVVSLEENPVSRLHNNSYSNKVVGDAMSNIGVHNEVEPAKTAKHAEWYDPQDHAAMKCEAISNVTNKPQKQTKPKSRNPSVGVNDNFVRLDLKNSAGSCRGARNLKKVNRQKSWRARHRFGKSDSHDDGSEEEGSAAPWSSRTKRQSIAESGEKCFASARNCGVDPLDDFMDGVFSRGVKSPSNAVNASANAPSKREGAVCCIRHSRPCKLLTVKKANKGNKGRKFYVCSMPMGEQCDFFKWEEDTIEATQRALLQSSSNSGFIARQVAASRARFKELTVPELRIEAKKRGLNPAGKKDQLLTRLLIWTRDEIADSVELDTSQDAAVMNNLLTSSNAESFKQDSMEEHDNCTDYDNSECLDIVDVPEASSIAQAPDMTAMIELSDDSSGSYDDDSEVEHFSCDEYDVISTSLNSTAGNPAYKGIDAESTLHEVLEHYFGYTDFREGQEWAIRRCLSHERTLLVAPTGQGKSLCYALPAALMDGVCLVVSPLISLMQDQLRQLPPKIPAATLSGSMTAAQMALIIDDILRGRYKLLFVSPERLASASFRRLIRPKFNVETRQYERQFPPVSLLCVDEAHCLSQWGHNFRPSYLRVKSLLPLIEPKSVLALTATAGPMVVRDICHTLGIPSNEHQRSENGDVGGVKVLNCNRDNIDVFSLVLQSNDERQYLLHKILKDKKDDATERKPKNLPVEEGCLSKGNVIVYVWRQKDTEVIAEQLIGAGVKGGVVCYHGGMDSNDRTRAQCKFLRGKARICVATVAFGLGINKPDIDGVIHLCLPPSLEHYLQEIGRAGRDGRAAKAIALPLVDEMFSRHSLAHSDRLAESQLRIIFTTFQKLVTEALEDIPEDAGVDLDAEEVFVDGLHLALPVSQTVIASDCKEESIETIFSLLEEESASTPSLLSVEGYLPDIATITLKKRSLDKLKNMEQIAQCIAKCATRVDDAGSQADRGGTAMESGFYAYSYGSYKFSIVRCARFMGPVSEPRHVYAALRRLQGNGELELHFDSFGRAMHLRIKQEGINLFRGKRSSKENDDDFTSIISTFLLQFTEKERASVAKVESMYTILQKVSTCNGRGKEIDNLCDFNKSPRLILFQELVKNYFSSADLDVESRGSKDIVDFPKDTALLACLSSDVSSLLQVLRLPAYSAASVNLADSSCADYRDVCLAKILHAIDAPRAPILSWYNHPLWGKYRNYSFSSVVDAVKSVCSDLGCQ